MDDTISNSPHVIKFSKPYTNDYGTTQFSNLQLV